MNRFIKRLLLVGLVVSLILPLVNVTKSQAQSSPKSEMPQVSPTPQHMTLAGNEFPLTPAVGLVTGKNTDPQAVSELEDILAQAGVKSVKHFSDREATFKTPVTIWMAGLDESKSTATLLHTLGSKSHQNLNPEGYVLSSGKIKEGKHVIVLAGASKQGTYYAVQTFRQLIHTRKGTALFPSVRIIDWPDMKNRGTIEGFYGTPWSHEDRLSQLDFYARNKMNMYIYAPKDDPYHRDKWREPYPSKEILQLKALVDRAKKRHVELVFAISPGQTIGFSDESDYQALKAKAQAVWDIGVRSFAIFLDDIDPTLRHAADKIKFGNDPNPPAAAQAYLLNRFKTDFIDSHQEAKPLITVPTDYWQADTTPYRERFAQLVDPNIIVQWTGIGVVAPTITAEDAEKIHGIFKHDLLIWDNYPVNDYDRNRLFLGPLVGRNPDLTEHGVIGLTANPMNEAEASKIPLFTVADYVWNPSAYNSSKSWDLSIKRFGGDMSDPLRIFAENAFSSPINGNEALSIKPLLDQFWASYQSGNTSPAEAELLSELKRIELAPDEIRTNFDNRAFVEEVDPYLTKLKLYGQALETAVRMLASQTKDEGDKVWQARLDLVNLNKKLDAIPQKMAPEVFGDFINKAIQENDKWFGAAESKPISSMGTYSSFSLSNMTDDDESTLYWTNAAANPGDYVGVDLGETKTINGVDLLMGSTSGEVPRADDYIHKGVLEYSTDGKTWTELVQSEEKPEVKLQFPDVEARFIRFRATAAQYQWVQVREFRVKGDFEKAEVTGHPAAVKGSSLAAAADGRILNPYIAERVPTQGEALTVKLPEQGTLNNIVVLQDPQEPAKAAVEIKDENNIWHSAGSLKEGYTNVKIGQNTEAIRLVWKQGSPAPVIYEIIPKMKK